MDVYLFEDDNDIKKKEIVEKMEKTSWDPLDEDLERILNETQSDLLKFEAMINGTLDTENNKNL